MKALRVLFILALLAFPVTTFPYLYFISNNTDTSIKVRIIGTGTGVCNKWSDERTLVPGDQGTFTTYALCRVNTFKIKYTDNLGNPKVKIFTPKGGPFMPTAKWGKYWKIVGTLNKENFGIKITPK